MTDRLQCWIAFWGLLACSFAAETSWVKVVLLVLAVMAYIGYRRATKEADK